MKIFWIRWVGTLVVLLSSGMASADLQWPRVVESADGVPISYEVAGQGEPTLLFIHGWSCDARYWRAQVPHFSSDHQVVSIDLAGHGHSGLEREDYTMSAFAQDVKAVVEALETEQVILVGHSMGGPVSVAAAKLMPERVVGIIGVDTFQNVGQEMGQEEVDAWMAPLREDFRHGSRQFVSDMFIDRTDASLRDWVIADMSAAPPDVALSAMDNMLSDATSGDALAAFSGLELPIVAINADIWPTDIEDNRQHQPRFDAVIIENTDHFLHMAEPEPFNRELEQVIANWTESP